MVTPSPEIDRLGLVAEVTMAGPRRSRTMRVRLVRDRAVVVVGAGKGAGTQGTASAYFEALDRYPDVEGHEAPTTGEPADAGHARPLAGRSRGP